jgi:diguanylate cyclase (GGDEF)-like protein/PAS domain S-box-containing protein
VPPPELTGPERALAQRATMEALSATSDVFETFFDEVRIGLALADLSSRYVRANATYAALVGRAPEDLVGEPFLALLQPDERRDDEVRLPLLTGADRTLQTERRHLSPDGTVTWILHGVTVVPGATGQPAWFALSAQDITERRRAEQELRDLAAVLTDRAVRDPLTGLANRTLLEERLRSVLAGDRLTGHSTALLFLDLDGFKVVNDRHGHLVGDAVLRAVAGRLAAGVRPSDTVARLGGDEFVVLVEDAAAAEVQALADRLQQAVSAPVTVGKLTLDVGVSVGLAVGEGGALEPAALLARADRGMYDAKRAARGQRTGARGDADTTPGPTPGATRRATRRAPRLTRPSPPP